MADALRQCEFFLLRYVPDAIKEEFVNIGVVLLDPAGGFAEVRMTRDWRRLRCLDPAADVEMLMAMQGEIRQLLQAGGDDRQRIVHLLHDAFSNTVQVTLPKGCLTPAPELEVGRLAEIYLEARRPRTGRRDNAGRGAILARMRDAFTQAGVWRLMRKKIAVSEYTYPGDPLKLDCGYRPNGVIRFFQATPLAADIDAAKVLAFSGPQIVAGVARVEKAEAELTAIVEDRLDREDEETAFALRTLEQGSILVATTAELGRLAERARTELKI